MVDVQKEIVLKKMYHVGNTHTDAWLQTDMHMNTHTHIQHS